MWKRQVETAKKLDEYFEKNNLKENEYDKFDPRCISFDGDTIIYQDIRKNKFIKENNCEYIEVPLLQDKIYTKSVIRNVHKVGDYYTVEIVQLNDNGWVKSKNDTRKFVIDRDGKLLSELGEQIGKETFWKDSFGKYEYVKNLEDNKVKICLYNDNMEKIAEREDVKESSERLYSIQDFVDDMCVCYKCVDGIRPVYTIFDKNGVVAEGTEKELSNCESAKKFFEQKEQNDKKIKENNEKWHNLSESEKDLQRYGCIIKQEEGNISLENENREKIFEFGDGYKVYKEQYGFNIYSENGGGRYEIKIGKKQSIECESNMILIKHIKGNDVKCSFVNTDSGKKIEFDGQYNSLEGAFARHFTNSNDSEIYDQDLNLLGMCVGDNKDLCFIANSENGDGEIKYYVYSKETGKKLTEYKAYGDHGPSRAIKNSYKDGDKTYYIIEQPDGNLVQVEV